MNGTRRAARAKGGELVLTREPTEAERDPSRFARRQRRVERSLGIAVPIVLLALWQAGATWGTIDARLFPAPIDTLRTGYEMSRDGLLHGDVWITTVRVLLGYGLGVGMALLFGFGMGMNRRVRAALEPTLDMLYVVPKLALFPVLLNLFGLGEGPKIALVAITVFFFVWIGTMSAVIAVPDGFRETGAAFGATQRQMFRHVMVPGALPQVFVALRVAAGVAVLVIVAAEFLVGDDGVGHLIFNSRLLLLNERMYVGIVTIALMGVFFTEIIRQIGRRLTPWAVHDPATKGKHSEGRPA